MAKEPSRTDTTPLSDIGGPLPTAPVKKKKGKWKITAVLFLVVLPLAAFALYVTIALNFSFSSGDRAGYVQKISRKGWVCKTWEGEITLANGPNMVPEIFRFTVRDDDIASRISSAAGRQVKLSYEQHRGLPTSCFGETEYFVKGVEVIGGPLAVPGAAPATAPAPQVSPPPAASLPPVVPSTALPAPKTP
jgi:hypothetical protein